MADTNDGIDYQKKYEYLKEKVKKMLDAQEAYFKSKKDIQLLKVAKGIESEVKEIVNPKPKTNHQATIDWLAQ